jgi:NAD dependent epimerase/dehydratase family enzyme
MRIAITGATGFVGKRLTARLLADGHAVVALTRDPERAADALPARCTIARWEPRAATSAAGALAGADAVVHLAGAGVADARWSAERKHVIRSSRVDGTRTLVTALAGLPPDRRPHALLSP